MQQQSNAGQSMTQQAIETEQLAGISEWVSQNLQGKVTGVTRLERWRPQWKVSYSVDGEAKAVLFRGDRPNAEPNNLKFEMQVMQTLEGNGIKIPHIHGWADSPKAFVMDWVDTEDRAPGMLHTAIENPSIMSDARWQAMLNYMGDLAKVHAIPVSKFSHISELGKPPETAEDIALRATDRMYKNAVRAGNNDPAIEFLQHWLHRNVPAHRTQPSFITGDAGQFMSAGTEVLALLDFEIANIGDTHWDLACFRGRHPYENMGDIPALYREYERVTGAAIDRRVVGFHTVSFLQFAGIAAKFFTTPQIRGANWIEGVLEYSSIIRRAFEAIAELQGITLDYELHLPQRTVKPWEDSGLRKLLVDIEHLPTDSTFEPWERDLLYAIPKFLLNHARYRDWFENETVADLNRVMGTSFDDIVSAEAASMQFIAKNDAAVDEDMVRIMHRRLLRFSMIVAGTDPNENNPLFHRLDPILDR